MSAVRNLTAFAIMSVIMIVVAVGVSTYRTYCPNATYLVTTTTVSGTVTSKITTIITTTDVSCVLSTKATPVLLAAVAVVMALVAAIAAFRQIRT